MLLSAARTRVQNHVDDVEAVKFTTTELDDALGAAQEEVVHLLIGGGANLFTQEASISSSSAGVVDLTTIKPLKVVNLAESIGGTRLTLNPARFYEALQNYAQVVSLLIAYVGRPTFPASSSTAFVWGHANVTMVKRLEALMCALAASELKVKEGERNNALSDRIASLRDSIERSISVPSWSFMPLTSYPKGNTSNLRYLVTAPDTLQLVY